MDLLIMLVIATIVITGVYVGYHASQEPPASVESSATIKHAKQSSLHTYKINTECELIYGFVTGKYPDDENLQKISLEQLLQEYPQEFAPWQTILKNEEARIQFFNQPLPAEFSDVLVITMMEKSSIKPELKPIAELILDPQGQTKLQQDYEQFSCQSYFDEKTKETQDQK
jgi:hypothetical protein